MIRTALTTISFAFGISMFLWSQVRVTANQVRSSELMARLSSVTSMCVIDKKREAELIAETKDLKEQLWYFKNVSFNKKHYADLKKIIKQRNIDFGISGN